MKVKEKKDYPLIRKRTKAREIAIQMMYCAEITEETPENVLKNFWDSIDDIDSSVKEFAVELFTKSYETTEKNDELIKQFISKTWTFDRIGIIEKNILRLALTELFDEDTPIYAIMDDYVTLLKSFTDVKTASFINGILENIRNKFSIERNNGNKK